MNDRKPSLITRARQWYLDKFVPYITIQQSNEHFFISRQLWKKIINDIPQGNRNNIKVWFKKYYVERLGRYEYLMIINPDFIAEFDESLINEINEAVEADKKFNESIADKPRSYQIIENIKRTNNRGENIKIPFCATIQFNMYNHIGFQGVQPSPAEIVYEYDIERIISKKFKVQTELTDRIPLRVIPVNYRPEIYGTRHAYVITPDVLHKPIHTYAKSFEQRRQEIAAERRAFQRARGRAFINKK